MLQSISWHEFISAMAVIALVYYLFIILWLYNKEFRSRFKKKPGEPPSGQRQPDASGASVIGGVRHDSGNTGKVVRMETSETQDLILPTPTTPDEPVGSVSREEEFIAAAVTDIITQVKVIVSAKRPREETASLLKSLLARTPELLHTPFCKEINTFIHESFQNHGAIQFSHEEINSWWQAEKDQPATNTPTQ